MPLYKSVTTSPRPDEGDLWIDPSSSNLMRVFQNNAWRNFRLGATRFLDNEIVSLGTDGDVALVERSAVLDTNTALAGVLIGTPVTPAVAANSLILANTTASGDVLVAVNEGGHSQAYLWIDASAGTMSLYGSGTEVLLLSATTVTAQVAVTMAAGANIILATATGTKIGTATNQLLGFWNATPVDQPAAYTQTYATADKTHANPTATALTHTAVGGTADGTLVDCTGTYSEAAVEENFKECATAINALIVDLADLKQLVNSVIDDLQEVGLVG